jgi:hypothetical protein
MREAAGEAGSQPALVYDMGGLLRTTLHLAAAAPKHPLLHGPRPFLMEWHNIAFCSSYSTELIKSQKATKKVASSLVKLHKKMN